MEWIEYNEALRDSTPIEDRDPNPLPDPIESDGMNAYCWLTMERDGRRWVQLGYYVFSIGRWRYAGGAYPHAETPKHRAKIVAWKRCENAPKPF